MNEFSKITGYKVNRKTSSVFGLVVNNRNINFQEKISYRMVSIRGINLAKDVQCKLQTVAKEINMERYIMFMD